MYKCALTGAMCGCLATIPMTLFMEWKHSHLPLQVRYPLPPREITDISVDRIATSSHLEETDATILAYIAHFSMGTVAGAFYGFLRPKLLGPPIMKGILYGLIVWTGNYLGILPALHILKPATQHPVQRTKLMIGAHFIWGGVLGTLFEWLTKSKNLDSIQQ